MTPKQLLVMGLLACCFGCADNTVISEGDRVGVVTKLSHKHFMGCPSQQWNWEGELSMAGGTNAAGQGQVDGGAVGVWQFSLPPTPNTNVDDLVARLKTGLNSGHTLRLTYRQVASRDTCATETDYMVTDVVDLTHAQGDK